MWKACPYCHEYSFDEHELVNLSYFRDQACKNCGKLVRNDGLRQLLLVPAIITGLVLGALVLFSIPAWLTPFGWVLLAIFAIVPAILLPRPVKADRRELTLFHPDPDNDKAILVKGWKSEQLDVILSGFITKEDSLAPHYSIEVDQYPEDSYQLTFPIDIHPSVFAALINYLQYPMEFGIPDCSITVVGRTTLDAAFDGIPESLIGQRAFLYLPENDLDCDIVYLQTESGANLAYSLRETVWQPEKNARIPLAAKSVMTI